MASGHNEEPDWSRKSQRGQTALEKHQVEREEENKAEVTALPLLRHEVAPTCFMPDWLTTQYNSKVLLMVGKATYHQSRASS
jgi:hypothetical protein